MLLSYYLLRASPPSLFCFKYTATTEIYTLSLHDALPIWVFRGKTWGSGLAACLDRIGVERKTRRISRLDGDRKSTRLNSSHRCISYAVFCLKKKKKTLDRGAQRTKHTVWQQPSDGHPNPA